MRTQLTSIQTARGDRHQQQQQSARHCDEDAHWHKDHNQAAAAAGSDVERWEPLSMAALMDYKTNLTAPGRGPFALGHVRLWPTRYAGYEPSNLAPGAPVRLRENP